MRIDLLQHIQGPQLIIVASLMIIALLVGYSLFSSSRRYSRTNDTYSMFLYFAIAIALFIYVARPSTQEGFHIPSMPEKVIILYTDRSAHTAFEAKSLLQRLKIPTTVEKASADDVLVATKCGGQFQMSKDEYLDIESDFTVQNIKYFVMKSVHPAEGSDPIPVRNPIWPVMRSCSS